MKPTLIKTDAAVRQLTCVLLALWALPGPLHAQGDGPLTRAIAREAARSQAHALDERLANLSGTRQGASDWSHVRQLGYGRAIVVRVIHSGTIKGSFVSADDRELVLKSDNGRTERIARLDVADVKIMAHKTFHSVSRKAAPFALIGMAAGIAAAVGYCHSNDCQGQDVLTGAGFVMLGGMAGAGVGAIVAMSKDTGTVIYRVP